MISQQRAWRSEYDQLPRSAGILVPSRPCGLPAILFHKAPHEERRRSKNWGWREGGVVSTKGMSPAPRAPRSQTKPPLVAVAGSLAFALFLLVGGRATQASPMPRIPEADGCTGHPTTGAGASCKQAESTATPSREPRRTREPSPSDEPSESPERSPSEEPSESPERSPSEEPSPTPEPSPSVSAGPSFGSPPLPSPSPSPPVASAFGSPRPPSPSPSATVLPYGNPPGASGSVLPTASFIAKVGTLTGSVLPGLPLQTRSAVPV